MPKFSDMRLGKKAPVFHPFAPKLASLILPTLNMAPPPPSVDYTTNVSNWPMFDNDQIGDCSIASLAHLIQLYTSYTKPAPVIIDQTEINRVYSAVSGWDGTPQTDRGAIEVDVLNLWMNQGVNLPGGYLDRIAGYARVNVANLNEMKYACWWFGGVYIGVNLPKVWQSSEESWDMPPNLFGDNAPGTWGGHAVPIVGYDEDGVTVVTWGEEVTMDWQAYQTYTDEAWAVISPDFVNSQGFTPAHFDWPYLLAAMGHLTDGTFR